ncbi:uncharacterized protein METZ01_LOCUS319015, partial [marine metagenome]
SRPSRPSPGGHSNAPWDPKIECPVNLSLETIL